MASASIEVSGPDAVREAGGLRAALAEAVGGPVSSVGSVEVDRSAELVIGVVGLIFSGVEVAKSIWDWWVDRRSAGLQVKILLDDGSQVMLSGMSHDQLVVEFKRRLPPGE